MQIVCIKYNFYNLINCAARQTLSWGSTRWEGEGGEGSTDSNACCAFSLCRGPIKLAPGTLTKLILATNLHDNAMCDSMGSLIRRRLSYPFIKWPSPTSLLGSGAKLNSLLGNTFARETRERDNLSLIWVSFTRATKRRRRRTSRRRDTDESFHGEGVGSGRGITS